MSTAVVTLHGFAYGEHLEGISQRSLGYRLLAPVEPMPWCAEVETLARRLQAAPYPDHWPPCDLLSIAPTGRCLQRYAGLGAAPDHSKTPAC